jgi:hypothetical protein
MPADVIRDSNDGKAWSALDERDLGDSLAKGDSLARSDRPDTMPV